MDFRLLCFAPLPTAMLADALDLSGDLHIHTIKTTSSDQQFEQLCDGSVDAVVTALDNVINWDLRAPQAGLRAIAQVERQTALTLVARKAITTIEQLRGGQLLVDSPSNGFVIALMAMLFKSGLTQKDYSLLRSGGVGERLDDLLAHKGDATLLGPGFDQRAVVQGCNIIERVLDFWPLFPGQVLVVSMARYASLKPMLDVFFDALDAARDILQNRPEDAKKHFEKMNITAPMATALIANTPARWHVDQDGLAVLLSHRLLLNMIGSDYQRAALVDDQFLNERAHTE